MNLTLFDLDNTLLAGDSDHLWGEFLVDEGLVDAEEYARRNNHFYYQYQDGTLDVFEYQRFALQPLVANPPSRMQVLREKFVSERIRPLVARHAPALIAAHRDRGHELVIITATNRFVTAPIAQLLGIEHLIATEPEMVAEHYTGRVAGIPSFQDGKVTRLAQWRKTRPQTFAHTYFYSDSHNDLPLLRQADTPVAVDPDSQLAAAAAAAGWPVISLRETAAPAFLL